MSKVKTIKWPQQNGKTIKRGKLKKPLRMQKNQNKRAAYDQFTDMNGQNSTISVVIVYMLFIN